MNHHNQPPTLEEQATCPSAWERPGPDGRPSLEQLAASITELSAHIDAATYRLLALIAEFDRRGGWVHGGFASCAHFLSVIVGIDPVTAREKVRVASALGALPRISEAMSRGELSYSKARAMTRIATPENEAELLTMARSAPASHIERVVREYRRVGRLELGKAERQQEGRHLKTHYDEAGMLVIEGRLPPELGALLLEALEGARKALRASAEAPETPTSATPAQLRADALGLLAERALPALGTAERGEPYQVMVHVDAEVLADPAAPGQCCLENGPAISGQTARRLTCDAPVVRIVRDARGEPLSVGRKSRRVTTALYRALRARDRSCVFPGCTRTAHLEAHHVEHWADGGATDPDNLVLLCGSCHTRVHEGGVTIEQTPDGLVFRSPTGFPITFRPATLPGDPVAALIEQNAQQGLAIDARTNAIQWWGEPLDAYWAVATLRSKDRRGATAET